MVRKLKRLSLRLANDLGLSRLVLQSRWRRQRLLILCYHGTAILDEHLWNPELYATSRQLRRRLELIRQMGCNVLPLEEALQRLYRKDLPPKSVVITYDDGGHDFYQQAYPILQEFRMPATVYLTTYYLTFNRPVYNLMVYYLLWKRAASSIQWPEVLGTSDRVELSEYGSAFVGRRMWQFPEENGLSGREKDALLGTLAEKLAVDYAPVLHHRLFHIMSLAEAEELARAGVDFQLHTHRHRTPMQEDLFAQEIRDNRNLVDRIRRSPAAHFCYPSGLHQPAFLPWLRESKIASATTCETGLASARTEPLLLPRLVDTCRSTEYEFTAWLSGIAALLPRRSHTKGRYPL